jgi:DUF4097 and DUF4098 domain-containing protein YvlB
MERTFDTPEPIQLYVELGSGEVQIHATDTRTTEVTALGDHADEVVVEQTGSRVTVIGPKRRTGFLGGSDSKIQLTVTLPAHSGLATKTGSADQHVTGTLAQVSARSGSGDIQLDTITGATVADSGSGDITVNDAGADVRIKSGSGDIGVASVAGTCGISTGSGDVTVGASGGSVVLKSGSGDLRVGQAHGDVSLSSASGDLIVDTQHRGGLVAKNASGDVRVGIPGGVPVWTDVSTVTGRISSNLEGAGQPQSGEDYIEVRAKTVSGDIALKQL